MMMRSVWKISFVLLFTFNCISAAPNPNCPAGWLSDTGLNNNCYKPYVAAMTWIDAEFQCRFDSNRSGHLASIHNRFEQNYLLKMYDDNGLQGDAIWIGLQNLNSTSSDIYAWIDGSPLGYTNWGPGNPTNSCYNHGVFMCTFEDGDKYSKWLTMGELNILPFICQITK